MNYVANYKVVIYCPSLGISQLEIQEKKNKKVASRKKNGISKRGAKHVVNNHKKKKNWIGRILRGQCLLIKACDEWEDGG